MHARWVTSMNGGQKAGVLSGLAVVLVGLGVGLVPFRFTAPFGFSDRTFECNGPLIEAFPEGAAPADLPPAQFAPGEVEKALTASEQRQLTKIEAHDRAVACGNEARHHRLAVPLVIALLGIAGGAAAFALLRQPERDGSTTADADTPGGHTVDGARLAADQPAGSAVVTGIADEIAKLAQLRDSGVITAEEFDAQKARLLGAH